MAEGKLPLVEDFYTLQGEGRHTGRAAYFIRLGGCDVGCRWCDAKITWRSANFPLTPIDEIVQRATRYPSRSIVITGGEPTLYNLEELTDKLRAEGLEIFLETSGTNPIRGSFDWICLSPKPQEPPLKENLALADELKVIVEKEEDIVWGEECAQGVREDCLLYFQPEWSRRAEVMPRVIDYIMDNPKWRISLQSHKYMHIP